MVVADVWRDDDGDGLHDELAEVREALCRPTPLNARDVVAIVKVGDGLGETAGWLRQIIEEMSAVQLGDLLFFATAARCLQSTAAGLAARIRRAKAAATRASTPVAGRADQNSYLEEPPTG